MGERILYKYLDADGGLKMLMHHNLQFTKATCLNDPFDCHPALFDYSDPPVYISEDGVEWPPSDFLSDKAELDMMNLRDSTWICSLSKVNNSLLMWSYYSKHEGICIGLDMQKIRPVVSNLLCSLLIGALELEVKYEEIRKKPNYFNDDKDYWGYQVSTKAIEWSHEKEVRLALLNPLLGFMPTSVIMKPEPGSKGGWFRHVLDKKCFDSVYLGCRIDKEVEANVISVAKSLNPQIKIYKMEPAPEAFKLISKQLN